MTTRRYMQLDVFADRPGAGNPLAVVLDAAGLDDHAMQAIARWTRLPETTFVFPATQPQASYGIRIFSPRREVPFAGHPSVGTAHAVLEAGLAVPKDGLLSKAYARERAQQISATAAPGKVEAGDPYPFETDLSVPLRPQPRPLARESMHTTHLAVSDREGNVVAYTFTIEDWGGSGIVVPGRGFLLNNELTDFDFAGPHPNVPEAFKRPRSSMSPTIVLQDGAPAFTIGSPGGSTIITTALQTIVNHVDLGMSLADALAAPRMSQRNGDTTLVETLLGFPGSEQAKALEAKGHTWRETDQIGAANGIRFNADGTVTAISEPLRHGGGSAIVQKQ